MPEPDLGVSLDWLRSRTSEKWTAFPPDVLPAFVAEMDFPVAPVLIEAITEVLDRGDLGYARAHTLGDAFAHFAEQEWGWAVDTSRVHAVADVMTGVAEVIRALTPSGSGVVVNPPVYPPFLFRTEQAERQVVHVPLTDGGHGRLDLDALDVTLARPDVVAYLLCSPHNPLGRVWSSAELTAVMDACERHDILLLVDEIHSPLVMSGARFTPVLSLDHPWRERTVVFHSASKGWNIPGVKCAVVVAGSAASSALVESRWEALFPSHLGIAATEAAYREPAARKWLGAVVAQLKSNRSVVQQLLVERVPGSVIVVPEASFLLWVDCTALGFGDDPSATFLERGRVALGRGPDFGPPGIGHVRVNIGTSGELLEAIVDRMASALG